MSGIPKVDIDGRLSDVATATVPVMDHGFLFGDSVYETLRAYERRFFRWDDHVRRLRASAGALELRIPVEPDVLRERAVRAMEAGDIADGAIRIVVTRGVGPMDIDPSGCTSPSVLIFARPRPRYAPGSYESGLSLALVVRRRNPRIALDPNVKSGNYLNSVLALVEARRAGAFECVMLNVEGQVTEGATSNVFIVRHGVVATPPVDSGLLGGITRMSLLDLCRDEGIPAEERALGPGELRTADEIFISSTLKQVMPITTFDGERVGGGTCGPVTRRLLDAYRAAVEAETGVRPEAE